MEHARLLEHHKRPNLSIMGTEQGEEIQTKGIDNLLNNIIAEIFSNVEKGVDNQIQEAF
jgi:hypothetical protein